MLSVEKKRNKRKSMYIYIYFSRPHSKIYIARKFFTFFISVEDRPITATPLTGSQDSSATTKTKTCCVSVHVGARSSWHHNSIIRADTPDKRLFVRKGKEKEKKKKVKGERKSIRAAIREVFFTVEREREVSAIGQRFAKLNWEVVNGTELIKAKRG